MRIGFELLLAYISMYTYDITTELAETTAVEILLVIYLRVATRERKRKAITSLVKTPSLKDNVLHSTRFNLVKLKSFYIIDSYIMRIYVCRVA